MKNVAVILAAGKGRRLGWNQPKQFLKIAGKKIIEHTVECFENNGNIDEIAIVVAEDYIHDFEEMILNNKWKKVKKILNGGKERTDSSLSAIKAYEAEAEVNLIFHDGVRPLVSQRIINEVCDALLCYEAVDVTVPPVDTVVKVDDQKKFIVEIPNRNFLRRGQTPQAFRLNVIKEAYNFALNDPMFEASDDCGIVKKYLPKIPIYSVDGEESNVKLTHPEDVYLIDKLFQIKTVSTENSVKDFENKVFVVFGGNSGIGKDISNLAKEKKAKVYVFSRSTSVDVSSINDVEKALHNVYLQEGKIDYVINTAAVLCKSPLLNLNEDKIRELININYLGAINTTLAAYKYLKISQGTILQFTSSSYTRGRAFYSLYSSSKAAVVNFVQAIAEEWAVDGIKINCINPQRTRTPMRVKNFGEEDASTLLKSEDVARIAINSLIDNVTGEVFDIKINTL